MRVSLLTSVALLAAPAFAQTAPPAGAGGANSPIAAAGMRYVTCLKTKAEGAPQTVPPEAAADGAIAGCKAEHDQLITLIQPMIASLPAEQQTAARAHLQEQEAGLSAKIAADIRAARTASAGTTPAAPAAPGK